MTPTVAKADRSETNFDSQEVYFFYEDQIGRPVAMSCYNKHSSSYFIEIGSYEPYFIALYKPFGQMKSGEIWGNLGTPYLRKSGDTILN